MKHLVSFKEKTCMNAYSFQTLWAIVKLIEIKSNFLLEHKKSLWLLYFLIKMGYNTVILFQTIYNGKQFAWGLEHKNSSIQSRLPSGVHP